MIRLYNPATGQQFLLPEGAPIRFHDRGNGWASIHMPTEWALRDWPNAWHIQHADDTEPASTELLHRLLSPDRLGRGA